MQFEVTGNLLIALVLAVDSKASLAPVIKKYESVTPSWPEGKLDETGA